MRHYPPATTDGDVLTLDSTSPYGVSWVTPSGGGGGGGGAPTTVSYLVETLSASLSAERRVAVESGVLSLTDAGANGDLTWGVVAGGISAAKLATDAVTTIKIVDLNVTTAKLADGAVTTIKIADLNVTTGKLAANAVTTAKIAANAVTNAEFRQGAATSLVGVAGGSVANVADIAATTDDTVAARVGGTIVFSQVTRAMMAGYGKTILSTPGLTAVVLPSSGDCTWVTITYVNGGGGGGNGVAGDTTATRAGGTGGGGSGMLQQVFRRSVLPDTLQCYVGAGGAAQVAGLVTLIETVDTTFNGFTMPDYRYVIGYGGGRPNAGQLGGGGGTSPSNAQMLWNRHATSYLAVAGYAGQAGSAAGVPASVSPWGSPTLSNFLGGTGGGGRAVGGATAAGGAYAAAAGFSARAGGTSGGGTGTAGIYGGGGATPYASSSDLSALAWAYGGTGGGSANGAIGGTGGAGAAGCGGGGGGAGNTSGVGGAAGNGVIVIECT